MADRADSEPPLEPIQFVPTEGSPVQVGRRDRAERIREALTDLRLVIDGCGAQPPDRLSSTAASLARHCSIFLRRMVLGDERSPRLLDDASWQTVRPGFDRVRKVPHDRRTLTLTPVGVAQGYLQVDKLDEEAGKPEVRHVIPVGPQQLTFTIQWPLPGMTDWLAQPTQDLPWEIRPEGLFESQPEPELDCDQWLGQQLVIFDNRGITLRDIFRVTVNTEAAHSPPMERLMIPRGNEDRARFRVVRDGEIHILSHITVCGVRYSHAVVIQAAMYLYGELARNTSFGQPEGEVSIPVIGFIPKGAFSPDRNWLGFDGGLAISLGGSGQSIIHRVRAPG